MMQSNIRVEFICLQNHCWHCFLLAISCRIQLCIIFQSVPEPVAQIQPQVRIRRNFLNCILNVIIEVCALLYI